MNSSSGEELIATPSSEPIPSSATPEQAVPPAGVGDHLKSARESKGLSLADVSQAIKINPRVLEQIESNAWESLSGHTFARGVVRSYSRFLQLDAEALMRELESAPLPKPPLLELPKSTKAALPVPGETQKRDRVAVFSGVVLVAMAVVAFFLIPDDWLAPSRSSTVREIPGSAALPPAAAPAVIANAPPATAVPDQAATVQVTEPAAVPMQTVSSAPANVSAETPVVRPAVAVGPAGALSLSFAKESWAEVRDRSGAILISENVSTGGERQLGGDPPYSIWLGNADGVRVSFRGQPVDLAPHTRQKVARLTLE